MFTSNNSFILILLITFNTTNALLRLEEGGKIACQTAYPPCPLTACSIDYRCRQSGPISCYCQYTGPYVGLKIFNEVSLLFYISSQSNEELFRYSLQRIRREENVPSVKHMECNKN